MLSGHKSLARQDSLRQTRRFLRVGLTAIGRSTMQAQTQTRPEPCICCVCLAFSECVRRNVEIGEGCIAEKKKTSRGLIVLHKEK
jgi:hypothetical protein